MDFPNQQEVPTPTQYKDEITATYEEIQKRNLELKQIIDYLEKENHQYKQQYSEHNKRVTSLNNYLEKSAKLFAELLDNTKSALQIGRLPLVHNPISPSKPAPLRSTSPQARSPGKRSRNAVAAIVEHDIATWAGTQRELQLPSCYLPEVNSPKMNPQVLISPRIGSNHVQFRHASRRKFSIEPLNMQKLREISSGIEEDEDESENSVTHALAQQSSLSTIYEESLSRRRELCVKITRLSEELLASHLIKLKSPLCNNSSFNISNSLICEGPRFSSTPHKLAVMETLGLTPTFQMHPKTPNQLPNFVNSRKRGKTDNPRMSSPVTGVNNGCGPSTKREESQKKERTRSSSKRKLLSPKKEELSRRKSQKTNNIDPVKPKSVKKRLPSSSAETSESLKIASPESTKRPTRTARPTGLKEQSLRNKLRRT